MTNVTISEDFFNQATATASKAARVVTKETKEMLALQDKLIDYLLDNPATSESELVAQAWVMKNLKLGTHKVY